MSEQMWYNPNKAAGIPFKGYPNEDLFYAHTDIIATHNLQNLGHAALTDALRAGTNGGFDHNDYLNRIGSLLKTDALHAPAHASIEHVVQNDGGKFLFLFCFYFQCLITLYIYITIYRWYQCGSSSPGENVQ
jgi:hypothetical protein